MVRGLEGAEPRWIDASGGVLGFLMSVMLYLRVRMGGRQTLDR